MWTSAFQGVVMFFGVLAVIINVSYCGHSLFEDKITLNFVTPQGSIELGGIGEIIRINQESDRIEVFKLVTQ